MYNDNTDSRLIPMKMNAAVVSLDQFQAGWDLARSESDTDPAVRRHEQWIGFDAPFANVPLVQVGIAGFDIDNRDTARLRVRAERITANGFMLVIETWRHSRVYGVEVSWLALGHA